MCHPAETDIRIPDVARWLIELSHAGAVAIHDSDRGWYVEIAERLWYRREDYQEGQPKYGPRKPKPAEQQTLPLGPVNVVERPFVPSAPVPTQAQSNPQSNPKAKAIPIPRGKESWNRAQGADWDSEEARRQGKFASGPHAFPTDDCWSDVCRELGAEEMHDHGVMWALRWSVCAQTLGEAFRDWRAQTPSERDAGGGNFAAYLNACFSKRAGRKAG